MERALVVQLARVGDLVQSLPALAALAARHPDCAFDVLCAAPLAPLARLFPKVRRVLPWDGMQWRSWASASEETLDQHLDEARQYVERLSDVRYDRAYVLNQHPRTIVAAHLLADQITGAGRGGLLERQLAPWAAYLRDVARDRRDNRVHLADAFCGMCDVRPLGRAPRLDPPAGSLPRELSKVGEGTGQWVALAVGAGDAERCVPTAVWGQWIDRLSAEREGHRVVLIGGRSEQERALAIVESRSPLTQSLVWDATGRTDLVQLAALLERCDWVIGSDTGPLHLGVAMGARAVGFYFSRARVHETGPYGEGHWVWQADQANPRSWPIDESVALMCGRDGDPFTSDRDWSLWESDVDMWGARYHMKGSVSSDADTRPDVWARCAASGQASGLVPVGDGR